MQSLERSIEVLLALARQSGVASLSDLAQATQLPPSTVHRILKTLGAYQLVVQNEGADRQYRFGRSLITLALTALQSAPDYRDMAPLLRQLRDETNECCYVSMLVDQQVVCLQTMGSDNPHGARFYHQSGQIMPIHASAAGKAIVAFQLPAVQDEILAQMKLERFTPWTIVSLDEFRACLLSVRERGFALCEEESELGVSAASVPIADLNGRVRASVTAVAPTIRIQNGLENGLITSLQAAARQMGLYIES